GRAHVRVDLTTGRGAARHERVAAGTGDLGLDVRGVDVGLHRALLSSVAPGRLALEGESVNRAECSRVLIVPAPGGSVFANRFADLPAERRPEAGNSVSPRSRRTSAWSWR